MGGRAASDGGINGSNPRWSTWPGISFAYAVFFLAIFLFGEECHAVASSSPPSKSSLIRGGYDADSDAVALPKAMTGGYEHAGSDWQATNDASRRRGAPTLATQQRGGSKESRGVAIPDRNALCERYSSSHESRSPLSFNLNNHDLMIINESRPIIT